MKTLPIAARTYLCVTYAIGIFALWVTYFLTPPMPNADSYWEMAAFVAVAAAAGGKKVTLLKMRPGGGDSDEGSMSLGFAMIFATMLRFGPQGAVIAGFASTLASCLKPRQPWYQLFFNLALNITGTLLASLTFHQMNGNTLELHSVNSIAAVIAACLTFFFVNTGAVAGIISLCTHKNCLTLWRESFLWTAPSYFIGASVSTVASVVIGSKLIGTLLCAVPVCLLTHASFRAYLKHSDDLIKSKEELANLYLSTIRSLALAIDAKDQYTHQHILRVQQYAVATAQEMGVEGDDLKAIETGALLHDIGKLGVPEYVLLKPGRLTPEEYAKIKEHPSIGADILDPVKFPWPVLPVVKYHHERWDGTGYPEGLRGEAIPRTARILAVADVYDALTSSRSYRGAWSHERAMNEIRQKSGTHFDPVVVESFCIAIDSVRKRMTENNPLAVTEPVGTVKADPISTPRSAEAVRHIQRASSELWALYEVAQTLSASLGLDDTLEILGRKLLAIFADTGCVFLLRHFDEEDRGRRSEMPEAQALYTRFAVGLNQEFFRQSRTLGTDSLSLGVANSRQTYLGPYDHDDLLPTTSPTTEWTHVGTALIIPIVHQGESLGTINLYHSELGAFGPHVQSLMETIVQRAAMALYNGLMFDRTRSHAITDPLTGLANIRYITEWMEHRIQNASESEGRFALLCLDLDSFKPINDNFGHQKGDTVLLDLAQLFRSLVGEGDLVGRNGGDEFVVLLRDAGPLEAFAMAERIQSAVQDYDPQLCHPRLGQLRIGVSVGTACFPTDGMDIANLLSTADIAMYRNKTERKLQHLVESGHRPGPPSTAGFEKSGNFSVPKGPGMPALTSATDR